MDGEAKKKAMFMLTQIMGIPPKLAEKMLNHAENAVGEDERVAKEDEVEEAIVAMDRSMPEWVTFDDLFLKVLNKFGEIKGIQNDREFRHETEKVVTFLAISGAVLARRQEANGKPDRKKNPGEKQPMGFKVPGSGSIS
jgi:ribosomal protein S13